MAAQTLVEYGALHAIAGAFLHAYNRFEVFVASENSKYLLLLAIALIVAHLATRRRVH